MRRSSSAVTVSGEIVYVDAVLHDTRGEPYTIKNAICLQHGERGEHAHER